MIYRTYFKMQNKGTPGLSVQEGVVVALSVVCWLGFVICLIGEIADPSIGFGGVAFFFYCGFATILVALRYEVRTMYNIEGGGIRDSLACFFAYPQALWQARTQVREKIPDPADPEKQPIAQSIGASSGYEDNRNLSHLAGAVIDLDKKEKPWEEVFD